MEIITSFERKKNYPLLPLASVYTDADNLTKLVSIHEKKLLYLILFIQWINFECKETLK